MDMCIFLHMTDETHPILYENDNMLQTFTLRG